MSTTVSVNVILTYSLKGAVRGVLTSIDVAIVEVGDVKVEFRVVDELFCQICVMKRRVDTYSILHSTRRVSIVNHEISRALGKERWEVGGGIQRLELICYVSDDDKLYRSSLTRCRSKLAGTSKP